MNYFNFEKQNALIIGGATGLGFEIAKGLVLSGASVILASRSEKNLRMASEKLNSMTEGKKLAQYIVVDITKQNEREALADQVRMIFDGYLDILVNSAGINIRSPLSKIKLPDLTAVLETNLVGPMFVTKACFPLLKKSSGGRVINIASIFASVSYPDRSNYAISKGGILQLTRTLAAEWAEFNITVNSISPGPFLTEINKKVLDDPENYAAFCRNIPLQRFGNPDEIITTALYLASPGSSYVTGSNIFVDGGWTAT